MIERTHTQKQVKKIKKIKKEQEEQDKIVFLNSPKTLYTLGCQTANTKKAIGYFKKVLSLKSKYLDTNRRLGFLYKSISFNKEAIYHLEKSLQERQKEHTKYITQKALLDIYIKEKMYSKACKLLLSQVSFFGSFGFYAFLKRRLVNKLLYIVFLRSTSRNTPRSAARSALKQDLYYEHNRYKEDYENILFTLVYLLRDAGLYNIALVYSKKLLKLSQKYKNNDILRRRIYFSYCYLVATIYECKNDYAMASRYFSLLKSYYIHPSPTLSAYEVIYSKAVRNGLEA